MRRGSEQPGLGTPPKRCELQLFLAGIRQAIRRLKALHLERLDMQFQQDWPKDKQITALNFLAENKNFARLSLRCASRGIDNFSKSQLYMPYVHGKLPISWVRMWNFTRIGPKRKKLWLSVSLTRRRSEQPGLGPPQKRCELQLFFAAIRQAIHHWKALDLGSLNMQFQDDWPEDKNYSFFNFLSENRNILLDWALWCASRGIDNFSKSQLYVPYVNGKLSISWVETCDFHEEQLNKPSYLQLNFL